MLQLSALQGQTAELVVVVRVVGFELDGAGEGLGGFVGALQGAQDDCQVVVGRGVIGIEFDGLAIGGFGFGAGAGAEVEIAQIGVVVRIGLA